MREDQKPQIQEYDYPTTLPQVYDYPTTLPQVLHAEIRRLS